MLISILGNLGDGKTLFLAILSRESKRDIHSNFELKNNKFYKQLKVIDLLDLPNNIEVYLDEAYTWLESRVSSKALNRYLSYILLQSRKRTINIFITAQLFSTVDIRFRQQSNMIILCEKIQNELQNGFRYKIINMKNKAIRYLYLPIEKAKKYFEYYDTYEIIEPYEKSRLEFQLIKSDTELLLNISKDIAWYIHKDNSFKNRGYTHHNTKIALLKNGFEKDYEPYVYAFLHSENFNKKQKYKYVYLKKGMTK